MKLFTCSQPPIDTVRKLTFKHDVGVDTLFKESCYNFLVPLTCLILRKDDYVVFDILGKQAIL